MNCINLIELFNKKNALEIGGPSIWMDYLYPHLEKIIFFNNSISLKAYTPSNHSHDIVYGDATNKKDLEQFFHSKFNLCFTSHVLEHVANPIKSLNIWKQVLDENGLIINVVPNKILCWDRNREYTSLSHLMEDYENDISENDMTHVCESSCMVETRPSYFSDVGVTNEYRIIHHHVFSKETMIHIHEFVGFKTIFCDYLEDYPLHLTYIGKI